MKLYTENVGIRSIGRLCRYGCRYGGALGAYEGKALMNQIKGSLPESVDTLDIIEIDEM